MSIIYRVEMDLGNGGYGWNYKTQREVYEDLEETVGHDEAANVEGWCEIASIGEIYEGNHYKVYILED